MRLGQVSSGLPVFFFALSLVSIPCGATPITIDVTALGSTTTQDTGDNCHSFVSGVAWDHCASDAYILTNPIEGITQFYQHAFDNWNPGGWTLLDGGELPGGKLIVDTLEAYVDTKIKNNDIGGAEVNVKWDYTGADKSDFFWTQGILRNFDASNGNPLPENYYLDIITPCDETHADLLKTCPPLYPYQYADRSFYDKPQGPMTAAHEDFLAQLSKVDWTNKKLTLFEGFAYGFTLSAYDDPIGGPHPPGIPEPATVWTVLFGITCIILRERKSAAGSRGFR